MGFLGFGDDEEKPYGPEKNPLELDLAKLKQDQADTQNKKSLISTVGSVAQGLMNAPTGYEMLYNKKLDRPDIAGGMKSIADNIQDPAERQAKLYKTYIDAKQARDAQDQDMLQAKEKDLGSNETKASRMLALKLGLSPEMANQMSAYELKHIIGDPAKLNEIRMKSQIEFGNQKALKEYENELLIQNEVLKNSLKGKENFDSLPKDKQETITDLAKKNASKAAIASQIDANMKDWDSLPDDQKVARGRQMIKVLNSTEGADAVGAEEAKRLGGKLEFALGNLTNSNPMQFGRDLKGFKEQSTNTSKAIRDSILANQGIIDAAYGRTGGKSMSQIFQASGKGSSEGNSASADQSKQPTGKRYNPKQDITEFTFSDGTTQRLKGRH